jgi:hypothetical protein
MSVRFVQPEHVDILREYLSDSATILIYPQAQQKATEMGVEDGDPIDGYDFGGDSDMIVDKVASERHLFFSTLDEKTKQDKDVL